LGCLAAVPSQRECICHTVSTSTDSSALNQAITYSWWCFQSYSRNALSNNAFMVLFHSCHGVTLVILLNA
jgi:hypothetical protein